MLRYISVSFAFLASFMITGITREEMSKFGDDSMAMVRDKCLTELKLTENDPKSKFNNLETVEPCFIACMLKENSIMDDKGMIDETGIYAVAEKFLKSPDDLENIKKLGKICSPVNEEKVGDREAGCERAMLFIKCAYLIRM